MTPSTTIAPVLLALALALAPGSAPAALQSAPAAQRVALPPLVPMTTAEKNAVLAGSKMHVRSGDGGVVSFSATRLGDPGSFQYLQALQCTVVDAGGIVVNSYAPYGRVVLLYAPHAAGRHHLVVFTLANASGTVQLTEPLTHTSVTQTLHGGSSVRVAAVLSPPGKLGDLRRYLVTLSAKTPTTSFIVREVSIQEVE